MNEPSILQITHVALYFFSSLLIGLLLAKWVMKFCGQIQWVDKPDERKKHNGAIPLAGGLLIVATLAATAVVCQLWMLVDPGVVAAAAIVFAVGFYDDRYPLRARYRFFAHLAASAILIFSSDTIVRYLGFTFGPVPVGLGIFAIPFTMIAITGLINAFNMVDGADGLCGGQLFSSVFWLIAASCIVPLSQGRLAIDELGIVLLPLAGALVAFLSFNLRTARRKRAAMFLGDGGSMMMGLLVAWAVINLSGGFERGAFGAASALWLVAVPLFDMGSAIIRRVMDGRTPMSPDRKHMHHLLFKRGMSVRGAVATLNLIAFVMGGIGVIGWMAEVPQYYLFWSLMLVFVAYLIFAHRFWQTHDRRLARGKGLFKPQARQA